LAMRPVRLERKAGHRGPALRRRAVTMPPVTKRRETLADGAGIGPGRVAMRRYRCFFAAMGPEWLA
jgi:hypothetical protein